MHACSLHSSQRMPRFWNARKGACHVEAKKYNVDLVLWLHQALKEKVCERCQLVLALNGSCLCSCTEQPASQGLTELTRG